MKLSSEQIEKISAMILKGLKEKNLVVFKADEGKVMEKVVDVITRDLKAEDDLDREVEAILQTHSRELDTQGADQRKMFRMIKGKLARERGIVL